jgi:ankyrin repeat protein
LIELVELFLERGVDVNWVNSEGWNALHLVCRFYKQDNLIADVVKLLLDYIYVKNKTKEGCNTFHSFVDDIIL